MKLLSTIFAILVLFLSVQPSCAATASVDGACCSVACSDVDAHNAANTEDDNCEHGCNPFQICACCAFCVVLPMQFVFNNPMLVTYLGRQWGIAVTPKPTQLVYGVWQPPQLG